MEHSGSILVVEDEARTLRAYARVLDGIGHKVTEAASLEEARAALRNSIFDVVLLDLLLPDGNGITLIEELRAHKVTPKIAVISGQMDSQTAVRALECDAHVPKPISGRDLERLVGKLVNQMAEATTRVVERFAHQYNLSPQEAEVVRLMHIVCKSTDEIAQALNCSTNTVKSYRRRIYAKSGCSGQAEVARKLLLLATQGAST